MLTEKIPLLHPNDFQIVEFHQDKATVSLHFLKKGKSIQALNANIFNIFLQSHLMFRLLQIAPLVC